MLDNRYVPQLAILSPNTDSEVRIMENQMHYDRQASNEFKIWFFKSELSRPSPFDDQNINKSEINFDLYGVEARQLSSYNPNAGQNCPPIYSDWAPSIIKQLKISVEETLAEKCLHDCILQITVKGPPARLGENRRLGQNRSSLDIQNEIDKIKPISSLSNIRKPVYGGRSTSSVNSSNSSNVIQPRKTNAQLLREQKAKQKKDEQAQRNNPKNQNPPIALGF